MASTADSPDDRNDSLHDTFTKRQPLRHLGRRTGSDDARIDKRYSWSPFQPTIKAEME
jgi:hypothetical protein